MSKDQKIKENAFDMGIAGTDGAMSVVPGFDTFSSPDVTQDSDSFTRSKTLGSASNTAVRAAGPDDLNQSIAQIYSKSVTPSPDEVITGLKYEIQRMIKPDKGEAKNRVLQNLKKDPHYYGKLKMLNIDDKEMMKPEPNSPQDPMIERIKVLNQMLESKQKKTPTPTSYLEALKETRDKRNERYKK